MQLKETTRISRTMGPGTATGQVGRKARMGRARRDATRTADWFTDENATAIGLVKDLYSERIQHPLSIHLDIERQRFAGRHSSLEPDTLMRIWFDTCEKHAGTGWVMADLEYEKDRREGRVHHWKRYSWSGDVLPVTGPQLSFDDIGCGGVPAVNRTSDYTERRTL